MTSLVTRSISIGAEEEEERLSRLISKIINSTDSTTDENKNSYMTHLKIMGMQGIQGSVCQQGSIGISGSQGVSGRQGSQGVTSIDQDNQALRVNISSEHIEDTVLKILKKHGVITDEYKIEKEQEGCKGHMGIQDFGLEEAYQLDKTFTLDEIITIIDSISIATHSNDFWKEDLINKKTLIEKFKAF